MQGYWVKGVIDELQLDELGKTRIVEQKTRRSSRAPSEAQKDTARLQVHLHAITEPFCIACLVEDVHNCHSCKAINQRAQLLEAIQDALIS